MIPLAQGLELYRALFYLEPLPERLSDELFAFCVTHQIAPFVFSELGRRGRPLGSLWRQAYLTSLARHSRGLKEAEAVRQILAGMGVIAWKGLDVAHRLYQDPAERPMSDHDILVREKDFALAKKRLQAAGFREIEVQKGVARAPKHYAVQLGRDGYQVDLHRSVRQTVRASVDYDAVFTRAVQGPLGFLVLDPDDALLFSVAHQAAHEFMTPWSTFIDLELWLRQTAPPWRLAQRYGLLRPLAMAMHFRSMLRGEAVRPPFAAARLLPGLPSLSRGDYRRARWLQLMQKGLLIDGWHERLAFAKLALTSVLPFRVSASPQETERSTKSATTCSSTPT